MCGAFICYNEFNYHSFMQLTPSQNKALSTERHLAIMANAGSGKTRVLVKRYVDLFERYPDLTTRNIVAITFTENAASELRARVQEEVSERLKTLAGTEPRRSARLRELRDSLPSAFIGTIHGFASRLLRAYPVEANIDASFAIVTGADQRLLSEDALSRAFYSALEESYALAEENATLHLFRMLGRHNVMNLVRALLNNRMRAAKVKTNLLAKSNEEILLLWRDRFERLFDSAKHSEIKALFVQLTPYLKSGVRGLEMASLIQSYLNASGLFENCHALFAAADKLITDKSTLHSQRIAIDTLPVSLQEAISEFVHWFDERYALLKCCPETEEKFRTVHIEYLSLLRAVFALYDQVLLEYASTKAEYGLLDFDDLIERLLALLDDPQVRGEITREFRFLMIDEYQDTDESQFELARMLTEHFSSSNNLAIVGDPKQAIYTFRNADAEVFHETLDAIRGQSLSDAAVEESIALALSREEEQGSILLGESFRMTRAPLAAINLLFRMLMREDEPPYSELIHGREALTEGRVEWICPPAPKRSKLSEPDDAVLDETDSGEENESNETALIARKIQSIIQDDDSAYFVESDGALRRTAYGDIAILLRSRGSLATLERSLATANIPYAVAKGSGFFAQQEILDITSYLEFLTTPSNDSALAAILRSPFFAVTDVELFQIAHHESAKRRSSETPWSLWQQFQSYAEAPIATKDSAHFVRAAQQLRENLVLAGRTSTTLLIEKIYAETGIFASFQSGSQPAQRIANLEKFLAQARAADQSGFSGLFDFVERIRYLAISEEQESQAEAPDVRGAVRIMTVHAVKGLEFPIVMLPFLQKQFNFDHQNLLDKELGLRIMFPDGRTEPVIGELIYQRSLASTIAEEKRILYVAMTRARDHLILSCTLPERPKKNSWLAWVCDAFGVPAVGNTLAFEELVSRYDSSTQEVYSEAFPFEIPLIRSFADISSFPPVVIEEAVPATPPMYLGPIEVQRPIGRFSATQLLRFKECPTKYHLSYILGMPEEPKLAYDMDPDEYSERIRGPLLGQIVHTLLEKADRFAPDGVVNTASFDTHVHSIFDSLEMGYATERASYSNAARHHVSTFLESPMARQVQSGKNTRMEWALQTLLASGDTLFGIIDRLFQDRDGIWTILDYKTEAHPNIQNLDRYRFQLLFYAHLVHLMYPSAETIRGILFFTATGETTEFLFSSSDFSRFADECSTLIEQIRTQENIPDLRLLVRNTEHCPECRFFEREAKQCIVLASQNPTAIPAM